MKTLTEVIAEHRGHVDYASGVLTVTCRCGWEADPIEVPPKPVDFAAWDALTDPIRAAHVAAAYREARTITVEQLAGLPDGTWIRDGKHDIGVKQDWPLDLAVRYPDRGDKINARIPEPIHVLYLPGEDTP